jgi:hypothetical protein
MPSKKDAKPDGNPGLTNGDLIQIEGALSRLVHLDEKMAVESSFRIIKLHRMISAEVKTLREALKRYIEYEQKALGAVQQNDQTLLSRLSEQYASEIREAREFLSRPYNGPEIPKLKLDLFKKADGTGVDIPTGLLNLLMPLLEE